MKYKSKIQNADHFNPVLMTQNGYPIYDIMIPSKPGYCSASGIAFYTEDEKILKAFQDLNTEERKIFLMKHPEYVKPVQDIFKESPEMRHPIGLAYNHLVDTFEQTVRKGSYGAIHLLEDDKLLIFSIMNFRCATGFVFNQDEDMYEFDEIYNDMKPIISKAYKEGKIQPDGIITGKALERLKSKHPDVFKEMSKHQKAILDILKSFKNELLGQESSKLLYENGVNLIVNMEINNKNYIITIPKKSKNNLILNSNNDIQEFNNINDVIIEVYKDSSQNKLNSFIRKMKM